MLEKNSARIFPPDRLHGVTRRTRAPGDASSEQELSTLLLNSQSPKPVTADSTELLSTP